MPRRHRFRPALPEGLCTRADADIMIMRSLVDLMGGWRECYRACRRKKSCASPTVACFDHNIEIVRRFTEDLAAWRRLDGPRELDELVEPATELFE